MHMQLPGLKNRYIHLMADREGLLPPSESTLPCHEVLHMFYDIPAAGLPRYRNLFKFERINHFLKQLLRNTACAFASIMKNYNAHERSTMTSALYLKNTKVLQQLSTYQPNNRKSFVSVGTYLDSIHIDPLDDEEDRHIIYDVVTANTQELRGKSLTLILNESDINCLLDCNRHVYTEEKNSFLKWLYKIILFSLNVM
jgi:hypothetical protein